MRCEPGAAVGIVSLCGEFLVDEDDRAARGGTAVEHRGVHAVAVEEQGGAGAGIEGAMAGHVLEAIDTGIRTSGGEVAAGDVGEGPLVGAAIVELELDFEVQGIGAGYVKVPADIAERARRHGAELGEVENGLAVHQFLQQRIPRRMIDETDEERDLRQRVGDVEEGGRCRACCHALQPLVFGGSGAAVEGGLDLR